MSVLIKIFGISLVGILIVGLLGCRQPNLYKDVYEAEYLRYEGKYRAAIAKYEAAAKKFPHFPEDTKIINVEFLTLLNYGIAFCYANLAETEGDVALYLKAEVAVKESYQTAILPSNQTDPLYLWGYILFKQERYKEAYAKFETLLGILRHNRLDGGFPAKTFLDFVDDTAEVLYGLGKVYLELGDKAAAESVFAQHLKDSPDSSYRLEIERLLDKQ